MKQIAMHEMLRVSMNEFDIHVMDINYLKRINGSNKWNGYITTRLQQAIARHHRRLGV